MISLHPPLPFPFLMFDLAQIPVPLLLAGWVCGAISAAIAAYWLATILVIRAGLRSLPPLEHFTGPSAPPLPAPLPRVSVIIPAHNEEHVIDEALVALRASTFPDLEIVLAADRCTDRTLEIARRHAAADPRIRIVEISACPPDWSGKCHAAWSGYRVATGSYLLFTDADTLFHGDLVSAALRAVVHGDLDLLSLLGRLRTQKSFERTSQPIAAMSLMRIFPLHRANRMENSRRRPFANGQFLLFKRSAYESFGTHERIRHAILEDLVFALRFNGEGRRLAVMLAPSLFFVRMYETHAAFRNGWKRIFIEAVNREIPRLRQSAFRLRFLALTPLFLTASLLVGLLGLPGDPVLASTVLSLTVLAAVLQCTALAWSYHIQRVRLLDLLRFPFGSWSVASIFAEAAADLRQRRGIRWARLQYDVSPAGDAPVKRKPAAGPVSREMP